jgi:hypothetical protein
LFHQRIAQIGIVIHDQDLACIGHNVESLLKPAGREAHQPDLDGSNRGSPGLGSS